MASSKNQWQSQEVIPHLTAIDIRSNWRSAREISTNRSHADATLSHHPTLQHHNPKNPKNSLRHLTFVRSRVDENVQVLDLTLLLSVSTGSGGIVDDLGHDSNADDGDGGGSGSESVTEEFGGGEYVVWGWRGEVEGEAEV